MNYPAGAIYDSSAPWNQPEYNDEKMICIECDSEVELSDYDDEEGEIWGIYKCNECGFVNKKPL
jgi:DNA-directed RNA polymerase subunit RPC12/RpoP